MALIILRCVFVLVAIGLSVTFINSETLIPRDPAWSPFAVVLIVVGLACMAIGVDVLIPRKRIETITAVYSGILIGLFLTYIANIALPPLVPTSYQTPIQLLLAMVLCYTCVSVLIQTKDDFRFIIPYVEFSKEVRGVKPYILDTSVIIDGRIADVVEAGVLDNQLIMPRFVLGELQNIADSNDKLRRSRGRRGLDILNRLRTNPNIDLNIHDREHPEMASHPVDMKLVLLARRLEGKLVTGAYNLHKVARIHNVEVLNLNDLANALKPVYLPGEQLDVRIVKEGEESGQGIGYLDDGTMIVVEGASAHINESVKVSVTSVLQTSAGRMIFGRFDGATP